MVSERIIFISKAPDVLDRLEPRSEFDHLYDDIGHDDGPEGCPRKERHAGRLSSRTARVVKQQARRPKLLHRSPFYPTTRAVKPGRLRLSV